MTNDGTTRTGHQLGVYDNGKLKIVSVVDEFGNPLTAQSPDSAWLKGRIVFAGDVYAEESQLKALYAYRNLDTNDPNWSQKPIDLGGMVVNAGIRLVDSGFAQQSLAAKGAASLTLAGNDALTRGQRVELSFAGSSQTLVYYIKSVNGRVVTLADTADNAFLPNGEALTLEQILKAGRHARRHLGQAAGRLGQRRVRSHGRRHHPDQDRHRAGARCRRQRDRLPQSAELRPGLPERRAGQGWQDHQPAEQRGLLRAGRERQPRSPVRVQGTGHAVPAVRAAQADAGRAGPD